jgi:hypothetical protein
MKPEKLTRRFENTLKGRSISDLRGFDDGKVETLLEEIVRVKPLNKLTETEYKALIEVLIGYLVLNLFFNHDKKPDNWVQRTLTMLSLANYSKEWEPYLEEIFDPYLDGYGLWNSLGLKPEGKRAVAKAMIDYLFKLQQEQSGVSVN